MSEKTISICLAVCFSAAVWAADAPAPAVPAAPTAPAAPAVPAAPTAPVAPAVPAAPVERKAEYVFVKLFRSNADPEKYDDPVRAAELFSERQRLIKSLQDAKRRAVHEDPRAQKIRREMNRLLDELTLIVESKEEVKRLNRNLKKLDEELDALPLKGTAAPENGTAPEQNASSSAAPAAAPVPAPSPAPAAADQKTTK